MGITRATEYSIRALVYMAMNNNVEVITKGELCKTQGVTPGFLTKIMQPLIKSGLVKSFRGAKGGFQLARSPKEITLFDIVSVIDDVLCFNVCLSEDDSCERETYCATHNIWEEALDNVSIILKKYTLAEIARQQVLNLSMLAKESI
ncbi:RrF2 family transcriptional regulator [Thermodesulfobacteriota bacterium]